MFSYNTAISGHSQWNPIRNNSSHHSVGRTCGVDHVCVFPGMLALQLLREYVTFHSSLHLRSTSSFAWESCKKFSKTQILRSQTPWWNIQWTLRQRDLQVCFQGQQRSVDAAQSCWPNADSPRGRDGKGKLTFLSTCCLSSPVLDNSLTIHLHGHPCRSTPWVTLHPHFSSRKQVDRLSGGSHFLLCFSCF